MDLIWGAVSVIAMVFAKEAVTEIIKFREMQRSYEREEHAELEHCRKRIAEMQELLDEAKKP